MILIFLASGKAHELIVYVYNSQWTLFNGNGPGPYLQLLPGDVSMPQIKQCTDATFGRRFSKDSVLAFSLTFWAYDRDTSFVEATWKVVIVCGVVYRPAKPMPHFLCRPR